MRVRPTAFLIAIGIALSLLPVAPAAAQTGDVDSVSIGPRSLLVQEGQPMTFLVSSSNAEANETLTVTFGTLDVDIISGIGMPALVGDPGTDYTPRSGVTVVLNAANNFRQDVTVQTRQDTAAEAQEAVIVQLSTTDANIEFVQRASLALIDSSDVPIPGVTVPTVPQVTVPSIPPISIPKFPTISIPRFPTISIPRILGTTTTTSTTTTTTAPPASPPAPRPAPGTHSGRAVPSAAATPSGNGYWVVAPDAVIESFGDAAGSVAGAPVTPVPLTGLTSNRTRTGAWALDEDGGVHARGSAPYLGSLPGRRAEGADVGHARAVDIDAAGKSGFVILDEVGGVHTFGSATYAGSIPGRRAEGAQIGATRFVAIAVTPSGRGYVIMDEDGGMHAFGDAPYAGSVPGLAAQGHPVGSAKFVGLAMAADGAGYWALDQVGGVFAFGSARYHDSLPGRRQQGVPVGDAPVTDFDALRDASGYWIFDAAGGVHAFGGAAYKGSVPEKRA